MFLTPTHWNVGSALYLPTYLAYRRISTLLIKHLFPTSELGIEHAEPAVWNRLRVVAFSPVHFQSWTWPAAASCRSRAASALVLPPAQARFSATPPAVAWGLWSDTTWTILVYSSRHKHSRRNRFEILCHQIINKATATRPHVCKHTQFCCCVKYERT